MVVGASSSMTVNGERSTIDGEDIDVGTTEGDPRTDVTGSVKLDPPTC